MTAGLAWLQLGACALLILVAGERVSHYGDLIARITGLGGNWIGLVLVASVTSLPELVTGLSAVTVAAVPDIAVGNVLGACVMNLAMIALLDALHRHASIYSVLEQGHVLGAAFGVAMLGVTGFALLLRAQAPAVGHVGVITLALPLLYAVAMRTIFLYERAARRAAAQAAATEPAPMPLSAAALRYAAAAAVVVAAALWLPFAAGRVADQMGWTDSFVGTLLVAATTTLPELTVTLAAVRIGALDLAIGNLVGSNLFNLMLLALDDLAYLAGPLLSAASANHLLSVVSATVMSAALIVALVARPTARLLNVAGWTSLAIALLYFFNAWLHFRHPG